MNTLNLEKWQYLPHIWSDKGFNGAVVNRALPFLHEGSLEILLKVPSKGKLSKNISLYFEIQIVEKLRFLKEYYIFKESKILFPYSEMFKTLPCISWLSSVLKYTPPLTHPAGNLYFRSQHSVHDHIQEAFLYIHGTCTLHSL